MLTLPCVWRMAHSTSYAPSRSDHRVGAETMSKDFGAGPKTRPEEALTCGSGGI